MWKVLTVFLLLGFGGLALFVYVNFGTSSIQQVTSYVLAGAPSIRGVDSAILLEFVLIVLMLPTVSALTLYSLPGLAKGPGWALLLTILSGLTLFAAQATFTLTSTTEKTLRAQGVQTQPVTRDFEEQLELHGSSIIHVFIESMPATLALEGVDSDKFQSRIRESLGGDALLSAVEAPSSATTLEGLASSMCGTQPVVFEETGGSDGPKFKDDFECISSISSAAGYENLFLQAASGEFQSKREFLEDRHFLVLERSTWLGIGSSAPGSWGGTIHDDRLLSHARAAVNSLSMTADRYYLVVLTLDTHYPYYFANACDYAALTPAAHRVDAYECSTRMVSDFIDGLHADLTEPTLVVVQGDHAPWDDAVSSNDEVMFAAACIGSTGAGNMLERPPVKTDQIRDFVLRAAISCGS